MIKTIGTRPAGFATLLALALAASGAVTNTYYVVSGNPTPLPPFGSWGDAAADIQTAVNKAQADLVPGTTECVVLVSNGTYHLTAQITITNGITLRSLGGREVTFINGGYPARTNRCIEVAGNPTPVTVDGFSITNGYAFGVSPALYGGGLFAHDGPATIVNCAISDNMATWTNGAGGNGGGMALVSSPSFLVTNCSIARNTTRLSAATTAQAGGGLYIYQGNGRVYGCGISNNTSGNNLNGGGLYVNSAVLTNVVVSNCTIRANTARYGGGAFLFGGLLTHCLLAGNIAGSAGGGASLDNASSSTGGTRLAFSTIVGNTSSQGGSGISAGRCSIQNCSILGNYNTGSGYNGGGLTVGLTFMENCLVAGNQSVGKGGGLYRVGTTVDSIVRNCTIVRNRADGGAGGVYDTSAAGFLTNKYANMIVYNNVSNATPDDVIITNTLVPANTAFGYSCSPALTAGVNSNITADPLFDSSGSGAGTNAVLGAYTLQAASPCIDAGTNIYVTEYTRDLAGYPRIRPWNGRMDMGAYEGSGGGPLACQFSASPIVGASPLAVGFAGFADGTNTLGASYQWVFGDGATSAWSADSMASHSYAARTNAYTVTLNVTNDAGEAGSRTMTDYIMVYPPIVYVATNGLHVAPFETWGNAATNIQSAIDVAGVGYSTVLVNTGLYLIRAEITLAKAVTVRSASTNRNDVLVKGAYPASTNRCFYITAAGAVLDGITVTNGRMTTATHAGGIYMTGGTVRNCLVIGNTCPNYQGGGIYMNGGGSVLNCSVLNNTAAIAGGGIAIQGTTAVLVSNCLVAGNTTGAGTGGGISIEIGTLANCVISNNIGRIAGGLFQRAGSFTSSNCVIVANRATQYGGGVTFNTTVGAGLLRNCLIAGNTAVSNGGGVTMTATAPRFENCTIMGNSAGTGGGWYQTARGTGVNCIVYFNQATNSGGAADIGSTATNNLGELVTNLFYSCGPTLAAGVNGNTDANPLFVSAGSGFGTNLVFGNYRLKAGSPCIDSGTNLSWMASSVDLDGEPRILGAGPNMGAYEKNVAVPRAAIIIIR